MSYKKIPYDKGEYNGQVSIDDKPDGEGTYTSADGDQYVGGWKNGLKHGYGTYTWSNGAK
jgi:hypothetical protein